MNSAKFIIQVCRGLVRHHRARRTLMFYSVVIAIVLVFAGATFLWPLLRGHPFLFLGYWAACVWVTFLALLLALYDMAKIREEGRRERQRLRAEVFGIGEDHGWRRFENAWEGENVWGIG